MASWAFAAAGFIFSVLAIVTQEAGGTWLPLALSYFGGIAAATAGAIKGNKT